MFEKKVFLGDILTDEIASLKLQIAFRDAEIERLSTLVERAKPYVARASDWKNVNGSLVNGADEWLKDAERGVSDV